MPGQKPGKESCAPQPEEEREQELKHEEEMVQADPLGESKDQKRDRCPHREGDRERGPNLLPLSVLADQGEGGPPIPAAVPISRNDPARYPRPIAQAISGDVLVRSLPPARRSSGPTQ